MSNAKSRAESYNLLFVFPDQYGAVWSQTYGAEGHVGPGRGGTAHVGADRAGIGRADAGSAGGGRAAAATPVLDRFAREGVLFENAFTAAPICTPYRGTLLTGRYPSQTGITENGYRIPPGERTLAQCLDAAGYDTVYYGKWHLGGPPGGNRWVPPEARGGFREFCGWESHHVDHWRGRSWRDEPEDPIELEGHETDGLTDLAADKLRELSSRERPFAMFISYQAPHPPCSPPRPHLSSYTANPPRLRENAQPHARFVKPEWGCDMTTEEFLPGYFGEISHLDAAFGRLLETLEETGLDRNTIVVFTSDHGEQAGSHGLFGKEVMYEESLRVPLAVRHPGGRAAWGFSNGSKASRLVSSVDLFPTLLDLLGVPVPDSAEGRSLVFSGEERECVFAEYDTSCIRTRHYKLVTDRDVTRTLALYDLAADPFEQVNRGGEGAQIEAELFEELRRWREDVDSRAGEPEIAATPLPGRAQDAKDMERTQ